jgi:hypothetical protein
VIKEKHETMIQWESTAVRNPDDLFETMRVFKYVHMCICVYIRIHGTTSTRYHIFLDKPFSNVAGLRIARSISDEFVRVAPAGDWTTVEASPSPLLSPVPSPRKPCALTCGATVRTPKLPS